MTPATLRDYLALARFDHWVKHVFIVPGIVLAQLLHQKPLQGLLSLFIMGFVSAVAVASANYVINEFLDAKTDAFHPTKRLRPAVQKRMSPALVGLEYVLFLGVGLLLASRISGLFLVMAVAFALSGIVYNVPPLRLKDRAFVDVLVESANNPIRLTLGWAIVDGSTLPPSSLVLFYWMAGAFLMAVKRLAETRFVASGEAAENLSLYRASFRSYTETSLLVSGFIYAMSAAFLLAVFLIKYRIEYLLSVPFIVALFSYYLGLGLREKSVAQTPELLFRDRGLMLALALVVAALIILTIVDLPALDHFTDPYFIPI